MAFAVQLLISQHALRDKPIMSKLFNNESYKSFLFEVKQKIQDAQVRAVFTVNKEMLLLYWRIGKLILKRQAAQGWGSSVINQLSKDLKKAFPNMKGYSPRNLGYMKRFALTYPDFPNLQQPVAKISWGHNIALLHKCPDEKERLWYAQKALEHGWSRTVMVHQIELGLYERQGKAITNFTKNLPSPQSDMAQQSLKDPYILDFLGLEEAFLERELEDAIIKHITLFLLELGGGFAFVGRQYPITVSAVDYRIDLLFYNIKLRCYMAVELKAKSFKPEYVGKMNFYLSALDDMIKEDMDQPSIGLILCKNKDSFTVKYALKDVNKPIGVSTFETHKALPENFQSRLPSIEDLERELNEIEIKGADQEE